MVDSGTSLQLLAVYLEHDDHDNLMIHYAFHTISWSNVEKLTGKIQTSSNPFFKDCMWYFPSQSHKFRQKFFFQLQYQDSRPTNSTLIGLTFRHLFSPVLFLKMGQITWTASYFSSQYFTEMSPHLPRCWQTAMVQCKTTRSGVSLKSPTLTPLIWEAPILPFSPSSWEMALSMKVGLHKIFTKIQIFLFEIAANSLVRLVTVCVTTSWFYTASNAIGNFSLQLTSSLLDVAQPNSTEPVPTLTFSNETVGSPLF